MQSIDVLVLGLGPAGASAAAAAAQRGCKVIAVDRKRVAGEPVQCAEFVPAMIGMDLAGVAGIAATVRQKIEAMATFVEDDEADLRLNFPGQMLDRASFDAALVAGAARAGAQLRFASAVRRVARDGSVELGDGSRLRARVIIGADGPHSKAGAAIGSINTELVETRQVRVTLQRASTATDIFLSAGIPGGYGWLFPKGAIGNLGAGVSPAYKNRLKPIVAHLHARLADDGRVGREVLTTTGGLIPVGGLLQPCGRLGEALVLLAGDAAGLANPVTGAGIASAVHSGRLAGEAAASESPADYQEELEELYRAALERALRRRRELLAQVSGKAALRRGWIAYPEYWQ